MTPMQAIDILEQATAQVNSTREGHGMISSALTLLRVYVNKDNKDKPKAEEAQEAPKTDNQSAQ